MIAVFVPASVVWFVLLSPLGAHGIDDHSLISAVSKPPAYSGAVHQFGCADPGQRCVWERTFGGPLAEKAYDIATLSDGGVVAVGHTRALKGVGHDILVMRIDRSGRIVWQRTFGGLREDHAYGVVADANDAVVVCGYTRSKGKGAGDVWAARIDAEGDLVWEHTFGGNLDDRARSMTASDDGYVLAGITQSQGDPKGDAWVLKIAPDGRLIWQRSFGNKLEDGLFQIRAAPDGSLLAVGYSDIGSSGRFDLWVMKLRPDGVRIWERRIGKSFFDSGTAVLPTPDGGCVVAGITSQSGYHNDQAWLMRLDAEGNTLWQRTLGGPNADSAWALVQKDHSRFVVVVATSSMGSGSVDAWLICFNADGEKLWERVYGGKLWDRPTCAALTEGGGLYVGGYTTSKGAGYEDFWLLRLDHLGQL